MKLGKLTRGLIHKLLVIFLTLPVTLGLGIFIVVTIPFLLFRLLHQIFVFTCLSSDYKKILEPKTQIYAQDDLYGIPSFNICACFFIEGRVDYERLKSIVREKVIGHTQGDGVTLEYPELQRFWVNVGGYFYWKQNRDFHMDHHVRYYHKNNETKLDLPELRRVMSRLLTEPWKERHSPWEVVVLHNYVGNISRNVQDLPGEHTALIFRFNHCLGDGYSILKMILKAISGGQRFMAVPKFKPGNYGAFSRIKVPLRVMYDLTDYLCSRREDSNPWLVQDLEADPENHKRFLSTWTTQVEVKIVKKIKNKFGVSFQTILQSVVAGAIRRLMMESGKSVPEQMTVFIPLPLPNHPGGLNFHTCPILIKLPVGERQAVKRVFKSQEGLDAIKRSTSALLGYYLPHLLGRLPSVILKLVSSQNLFTLGMSCFPGLDSTVYFDGKRVTNAFFSVGAGRSNVGATISTLSCFGKIVLVLTMRKSLCKMEVLDKFNDFIQEEIQTLLDSPWSSVEGEKFV